MSARRPRTFVQRAFARLRRAIDPDSLAAQEALHALAREVHARRKQDEAAARTQAARLHALETSVRGLQGAASADQRQLTRIRQLLDKQRDLVSHVVRRANVDEAAIRAEQRVMGRLARLSRSRLPIVVGPWTGEVGFELLYWIPFLQWMRETFPIDPERLIVVSRGGVADWYRAISPHYDDLFQFATPAQFRAATSVRMKQQEIRRFDRDIVRQALRRRGLTRAHLIHPTLMYALFDAFWRYTATVTRVDAFARFRRLQVRDVAGVLDALPPDFVAVRFYFSDCFPDTPENRRFAAAVVEGLAARGDVVLLNNDLVVDDHRDLAPPARGRVHVLSAHMTPETNLAIQTAAISRARAFVGTYGGYSYLAPFCGVSSVAFYSRTTFKRHHLELAHRMFQRLGAPRLVPVDVAAATTLADAVFGLVPAPALD